MGNIESKWIIKIVIVLIGGLISGQFVSFLLGLILTGQEWELLLSSIVPLFIIVGLLYVHSQYQKEKDDVIGSNRFD